VRGMSPCSESAVAEAAAKESARETTFFRTQINGEAVKASGQQRMDDRRTVGRTEERTPCSSLLSMLACPAGVICDVGALARSLTHSLTRSGKSSLCVCECRLVVLQPAAAARRAERHGGWQRKRRLEQRTGGVSKAELDTAGGGRESER
jgi:hypothetical protein